MRHTLPVSLALAILAALGVTACSPAVTPTILPTATAVPPTPMQVAVTQVSQIVGVWQTFSPHCAPGFMLIRPDGTYTWSCKRDGSDGLSGTFRFDGGDFVIMNDYCGVEGKYQIYPAGKEASGRALVFKLVKDDCTANVDILTTQEVTWDSALP